MSKESIIIGPLRLIAEPHPDGVRLRVFAAECDGRGQIVTAEEWRAFAKAAQKPDDLDDETLAGFYRRIDALTDRAEKAEADRDQLRATVERLTRERDAARRHPMAARRHPMAPERCPACSWTNINLVNYGSTDGGSRWRCHGCAARELDERDSALARLATLEAEREGFRAALVASQEDYAKLRAKFNEQLPGVEFVSEVYRLQEQNATLEAERDAAVKELNELLDQILVGPLEAGTMSDTIIALRKGLDAALAERDAARVEVERMRPVVREAGIYCSVYGDDSCRLDAAVSEYFGMPVEDLEFTVEVIDAALTPPQGDKGRE